jgi:hypothetical protein
MNFDGYVSQSLADILFLLRVAITRRRTFVATVAPEPPAASLDLDFGRDLYSLSIAEVSAMSILFSEPAATVCCCGNL